VQSADSPGLTTSVRCWAPKPINVNEVMDTLNEALEFAELGARFRELKAPDLVDDQAGHVAPRPRSRAN
jgi:hypothetical protein